jgi:hypothetical protein
MSTKETNQRFKAKPKESKHGQELYQNPGDVMVAMFIQTRPKFWRTTPGRYPGIRFGPRGFRRSCRWRSTRRGHRSCQDLAISAGCWCSGNCADPQLQLGPGVFVALMPVRPAVHPSHPVSPSFADAIKPAKILNDWTLS